MKRLVCALLVLTVVFGWPFGWSHRANFTLDYEGSERENYSLELPVNLSVGMQVEGRLNEDGEAEVWADNCTGKV